MKELIDKIEELVKQLHEVEAMRDFYKREWLNAFALLVEEKKERERE